MQPIPISRATRSPAAPPRLVVIDTPRSRKVVWVWLPVIILVFVAAAVAVPGYRGWRDAARNGLRTETVSRGAVIGVLRLEGRLQPQGTVRVGSLASGQVTSVAVDVWDPVSRGQTLARLDDLEQRSALADARASSEVAEIQSTRAEKHLAEELDKLDDAGSSAGDLGPDDILGGSAGSAQLDSMSAYVQVDRVSAKRALARGVLARRVIRSPIDGIILAKSIDAGETITYSPPGPPLFIIGKDPARLRLEVEIDDGYVAHVRPASISLAVADYPSRSFAAQIRQVLPANTFPLSGGRYRLVMDVDNKSGALRPGMKATFALPQESADSALRVPVAALALPPPGSGPRDAVVFVVDAHGVTTPLPVEVGVVNGHVVEIRAGSLRPGTAVVVAGSR